MQRVEYTGLDGTKSTILMQEVPEFKYTEEYRDQYTYLVSEYYATGEGSVGCILVTRDSENVAIEMFVDIFDYYARGMQKLTGDEFWAKYKTRVPEFVFNVVHREMPPAFVYHSQYYLNFY